MKKYGVKKKSQEQIKAGHCLLKAEDFLEEVKGQPGEVIGLVDHQNHCFAKAYLGAQNKGIGWVISLKNEEDLNAAWFYQLFLKAREKRQAFFSNPLTNAWRAFNGEGDGLGGVTMDWYNGYVVTQWYSQGIYRYRQQIVAAFQKVYPEMRGMVGKNRFQSAKIPHEQLIGEPPEESLFIRENGVNYCCHLNQGWMTGIFLDQRQVRFYLMTELAAGKRVLNTFSYTGAFSVAAAMGGALSTCSVDLANRTRELTAEQFAANGIRSEDHAVYVMDVFDFYRYAKRHHLTYDLIVMDPPSFSRNKKKIFRVKEDYQALVEGALPLLNEGGHLICSTNSANFSLKAFRQAILQGSQGNHLQEIKHFGLGEDFPTPAHSPESQYLKVLVFQKNKGC